MCAPALGGQIRRCNNPTGTVQGAIVMINLAEPFIASELDFHRERITQDFAAAELSRRRRVARRQRRQQKATLYTQRRNAPRTV